MSTVSLRPPHEILYSPLLRSALGEDLGARRDLTTESIVSPSTRVVATVVARQAGCLAGLFLAEPTFRLLDPGVAVDALAKDGDRLEAEQPIARVEGSAAAVLTGERTVLNLVGHLSGVATATADLVARTAEFGTSFVDTRKTTPGLRLLEKYAVRAGGGRNHRFGLDDAVLIKDNHIAIAGGVGEALGRVRECLGHTVKVEIEVDTLEQLEQALRYDIDSVLLDNMEHEQLRRAVEMCRGRVVTEASGAISAETVVAVAATGVDVISVGWITHSAPSLDVGLDILAIP